ncbi:hypothetical protein CK501_07840 [Halovibrio salipaludis]|uniref:Uncharacterized protein n=1 Tax=Halovibrio salipaludis TaxID=2032626 RepID=A0A2A2F6K0_9GAMM|nr:hypothetical protein CK501_07840 [Halovibrio salipaludis]
MKGKRKKQGTANATGTVISSTVHTGAVVINSVTTELCRKACEIVFHKLMPMGTVIPPISYHSRTGNQRGKDNHENQQYGHDCFKGIKHACNLHLYIQAGQEFRNITATFSDNSPIGFDHIQPFSSPLGNLILVRITYQPDSGLTNATAISQPRFSFRSYADGLHDVSVYR